MGGVLLDGWLLLVSGVLLASWVLLVSGVLQVKDFTNRLSVAG